MLTLKVTCPACEKDVRSRGSPDGIIGIEVAIPLTNERFHPWRCRFGHDYYLWLEHRFYELLLYRAFQDLKDGNQRGAVFGFYSAWDTFVADWLTFFMQKHGSVSPKEVPHQVTRAEPRLGMYAAAVLQVRGAWPKLASDKSTSLRNKVVHDNKMPTVDETLRLADDIRACIRDGQESLDLLWPNCPIPDADELCRTEYYAYAPSVMPSLMYSLPASFALGDTRELLVRWPVPLGAFLGILPP